MQESVVSEYEIFNSIKTRLCDIALTNCGADIPGMQRGVFITQYSCHLTSAAGYFHHCKPGQIFVLQN